MYFQNINSENTGPCDSHDRLKLNAIRTTTNIEHSEFIYTYRYREYSCNPGYFETHFKKINNFFYVYVLVKINSVTLDVHMIGEHQKQD